MKIDVDLMVLWKWYGRIDIIPFLNQLCNFAFEHSKKVKHINTQIIIHKQKFAKKELLKIAWFTSNDFVPDCYFFKLQQNDSEEFLSWWCCCHIETFLHPWLHAQDETHLWLVKSQCSSFSIHHHGPRIIFWPIFVMLIVFLLE